MTTIKEKELYEELAFGLAVAIGLEAVTTGATVANPFLTVYNQAKLSMTERRLNVQLKDEFAKRQHSFKGLEIPNAFDESIHVAVLQKHFGEEANVKNVAEVEKLAKKLKSYSRGEAGAAYSRERKKGNPSGTYNDEDLLKDILKAEHYGCIDANFEKWVSDKLVAWKKDNPNADLGAKQDKQDKLHAEKKEHYASLKERHGERQTPVLYMLWTLCGQPGLDLTCLQAEASPSAEPKSAGQRRGLREQQEAPSAGAAAAPNTTTMLVGEDILAVEHRKIAVKEGMAWVVTNGHEIENLEKLMKMMEEDNEHEVVDPVTGNKRYTEEFLLLRNQKKEVLKRKRPEIAAAAGGGGGPLPPPPPRPVAGPPLFQTPD